MFAWISLCPSMIFSCPAAPTPRLRRCSRHRQRLRAAILGTHPAHGAEPRGYPGSQRGPVEPGRTAPRPAPVISERGGGHGVRAAAGPPAAPLPAGRVPDRRGLQVRRRPGQLPGRARDLLRLPVAVPPAAAPVLPAGVRLAGRSAPPAADPAL